MPSRVKADRIYTLFCSMGRSWPGRFGPPRSGDAVRDDAATGLLDFRRLGELLSRIRGRILHKPLRKISPLAVPIMLEIGREPVYGEAEDAVLADAADVLIEEAIGDDDSVETKGAGRGQTRRTQSHP